MTCTRCDSSGFLNIDQTPDGLWEQGVEAVQAWIAEQPETDVQVCDCCGSGEDWHGEPGQHFTGGDERGRNGPYAYNGGLPECN